ncbi:hypothetical protein RMR16_004210 [Agrobacterium sp. rho-13.3]|uniref:hypothetical protein n=1 Tax=Agrobacterium sp. rho-13.3 TaxID=3072980 RepID=UPI002A13444B|nr:hypothetical protein [Agrobacterium sp. rho-13.3]MDX8309015.1 hypothetical protein [Agrobacterium sp. rho-13.3]
MTDEITSRPSHLLHDCESWFTEASKNCNAVEVTFIVGLKQSRAIIAAGDVFENLLQSFVKRGIPVPGLT